MRAKLSLVRAILQEMLFLEKKEEKPAHDADGSESSIDSQIDRYFIQYEKEAQNSQKENCFRDLARRIVEAEDDDEEDLDNMEIGKKTIDKINVESFANSLVRLIDNFESLVEIRSTIARRALAYIDKVYEVDVVNALRDTLHFDHDIIPGQTELETKDSDTTAPLADRSMDIGTSA